MKTLVLMILTLVSTFSYAELREGAFTGSLVGSRRTKVILMLKRIEGRDGSFMAVMEKRERRGPRKMAIYLIDPDGHNRYTMTPYSVTQENGDMAIEEDNPSLVLSISSPGRFDDVNYNISSSNSGNTRGITESIRITDKARRYKWVEFKPGNYTLERGIWRSNDISLGDFGIREGQATATFTRPLSGEYTMREKLPYLYTVNANETRRSGTITSPVPARIGIFVKWRRHYELIFVDPTDESNITVFRRKKF